MAPVALAFAVLRLTGSAGDLGLVLAAHSIPQVICLLVGGVAADRFGRHRMLIVCSVVAGAGQLTVAIMLGSGHAAIWQIAALEAVNGAAEAFLLPAARGAIPQTVPFGWRQQATALTGLAEHLAMAIGAAVGGVVVAAFGPSWAIATDALSFFAAAGCFARLRLGPVVRTVTSSALADLLEGWRVFRKCRWLWVFSVESALWMFATSGSFQVLGPLISRDHFGGARAWGLIVAAKAAGTIAGGFVGLWIRPRRPLLTATWVSTLYALVFVLLAVTAPLPAIAVASFIGGLGLEVYSVQFETTVQQHVPGTALSRVLACDAFLSFAFMPLGQAAASPLAHVFGTTAVIGTTAVLLVVSAIVVLMVRDVRTVVRPEPPAQARVAPAGERA